MKYGIYSDIHGNLEALVRVMESMEQAGVERQVCLGDAVGYGPNPNECIGIIAERAAVNLLGNHDNVALGRESSEFFNFYARKAIEWTRENLEPASIQFLEGLSYMAEEPPLTFVHASPRSPADWNYVTSLDDAVDCFSFFSQRMCFIGHTHLPSIVIMRNEEEFRVSETLFHTLREDERVLVNVGSVGQPRDRVPLASWCYCDTQAMSVEIVRVAYDVHATQQRMRELGFAEFLIGRLAEGR